MLTPKLQMLQRTIKRLVGRGASQPLENVLHKAHTADLGFLLPHFSGSEQKKLLAHLKDDELRAEVISSADSDVAAQILGAMEAQAGAQILSLLEPDDASDLLQHLPQPKADELLALLRGDERTEVEDLNRYDQETAGGIMSPRFFALNRDTTAGEAIEELQRVHDDLEMVFYVYVVNEVNQLLGVVSLRQLVTAKRATSLIELMTSDVVSVTPDEDQEEVAKIASRFGLLAVPVVDDGNKLIGIVTVDDVIDVLREEAAEDMLRMAGAGDGLAEQEGFLRATSQRARWLFIAAIGGILGAGLLAAYQRHIGAFVPVVFLVPFVLGVAGNVGLQAATLINQRMLQGRLRGLMIVHVLRQGAVGTLLGLIYGIIAAVLAYAWFQSGGVAPSTVAPLRAALALGGATATALVVAAVTGGALPLTFARIRIDPALASGPIGALAVDLLALFVFLSVSSVWL